MTVPWKEKSDEDNEQFDFFDSLQRLAVIRIVDLDISLETCLTYSPEYLNLHSKTEKDTLSKTGRFETSRYSSKTCTSIKTAAFYCFRICVNIVGDFIAHLTGLILVYHYTCKRNGCFKKQFICIRTCGKHRKSACKSSCFGLGYNESLEIMQKIMRNRL